MYNWKKELIVYVPNLEPIVSYILRSLEVCAILEVNKKDLLQYSCKKNAKGIAKLGKKNKKVLRQSCNSIDIF